MAFREASPIVLTRLRRGMWLLLAAAFAIAATGLVIYLRTQPVIHVNHPPPAVDTEWQQMKSHALTTGHVELPHVLAELRVIADGSRGPAGEDAALSPAGVVVDTTRPTFTWPRRGGSYAVVIADSKDNIVRSGTLNTNRWTVDRDLHRDETYTWQVKITDASGATTILPSPDHPPARVRVLGERQAGEIERALRESPNDHLLLGLLYARAGVVERAKAELLEYASAAGTPAARKLADQLGENR